MLAKWTNMMKRLYFLTPTLKCTKKIMHELIDMQIDQQHIHVVGRDHHALQDANLLEAGVFQSSDLLPSLERGAALGGVVGMLVGVVAIVFSPAGLAVGGGAVLGLGLLGAVVGAWSSSMIGVSVPDAGIARYEKAIKKGKLLMMVDVPKTQEEEIAQVIQRHHPEAEIRGVDLAHADIVGN